MSDKKLKVLLVVLVVVWTVSGVVLGQRLLTFDEPEQTDASAQADAADGQDVATITTLADHDATVYTESGEPLLLSEIADGKPLVINFWATWCPYCVEELPDFQKIYAEFGDRVNFAFVDVADGQRERVEDAAAWLTEKGFDDLPAYYDTSLEAVGAFGATAYPTTVIASDKGEILTVCAGQIDPKLMRQALNSMLG